MSTLSSLRLQVYDHTGRTDKAQATLDGLNYAIEEIVKELPTRDMRAENDLSIVSGDLSVALPSNYFHVVEARFLDTTNERSYPLVLLSKREFTKRIPLASTLTDNRPVVAYEESGSLFFAPPSVSSFTIRVTTDQRHVTTSAAATVPIKGFDLPLVLWASHYVYGSIQMFQQSQVFLARYKDSVKKAMDAEQTPPGWDRVAKPFRRSRRDLDPAPWLNPFKDYHPHGQHDGSYGGNW